MNYYEERSQFIDSMIENVRQLPVQDVIGQRISLSRNGRHYMGLCPFHRDKKIGSFIVTPDKSMWKCFTCGDGYAGDSIKFVSLYENTLWLESAFNIALENGLIRKDEYDKYNNISKAESIRIEKKHDIKEKTVVVKKAPNDVIEKVYLAMKNLSPLKKNHREHLLNDRKLPEERIDADYFSFPNYGKKGMVKKILEKTGVSPSDIIHVPGFFFDKKSNSITYMGSKGIGILIRDPQGHVSAIQIRRDVIKEGQSRYHWFSSAFTANDSSKYIGGCGCGSAKDVLYPRGNKKHPILCITEGRFKSEVITGYGNTCISLQGVSSWKGIEKEINQIMIKTSIKYIYIMFDADMMTNKAVFDQTVGLSKMLLEKFPQINTRYALWPVSKGKGIDDLINAGHASCVKYEDIDVVQNIYDEVYKGQLMMLGAKSIRDVEDVEAFQKCVLEHLEEKFELV